MSVSNINKKYKPGSSWAAEAIKKEWAIIEERKKMFRGAFDNIFSIWILSELGEFESLTEYNGFLTEV